MQQATEVCLNEEAVRMMELAYEESRRRGHPCVGTEHLLLGMTRLERGPTVEAFRDLGIDLVALRETVEASLKQVSCVEGVNAPDKTPAVTKCLEMARTLARQNCVEVHAGHILVALFGEGGGVARRILVDILKLDVDKIRFAIIRRMVWTL